MKERIMIVLTPYESRRLIAKAVSALPSVQSAKERGWVVVATGSSTGYVAEEITGQPMIKENFISGHITEGETWSTPDNPDYIFPVVLHKGERKMMKFEEALSQYGADDVFIKGANAVDPQFFAAIMMASSVGGTIGAALGTLQARGSQLIIPVGLEKLIPSVPEAVKHTGIHSYSWVTGTAVGMMPVINATVVTEIQALYTLCGVEVWHVGSGGIAGSEGAVTLVAEGTAAQIAQARKVIEAVKGEVPLKRPNGTPRH